jgi:hypothetical protein
VSSVMAGDVSSVAVGIGKLRSASLEQAEAVEGVTETLAALRALESETGSMPQQA